MICIFIFPKTHNMLLLLLLLLLGDYYYSIVSTLYSLNHVHTSDNEVKVLLN